jgi:hypothetical protein
MCWPAKESLEYFFSVATILGFPFMIAAVIYGARQFALGRKAGSSATLVAINETLRQCWLLFLYEPDPAKRRDAFADLVYAVESACAIYNDNRDHQAFHRAVPALLFRPQSINLKVILCPR